MMRLSATVSARCTAVIALSVLVTGCANLRQPVPRGAAAPLADVSEPPGRAGLSLGPARMAAPIGSEVVMIASMHDAGGGPLVGQPVEWMLAQDGAGQFVTVVRPRSLGRFAGVDDTPLKIDNTYARGHTTRSRLVLRRGTADPGDDITVRPGEAWISVTSPTTGTSFVTCYGPTIPGWELRHQTAEIYWVDAQFSFPPPAISAAGGRQTITTTVTRQSDQAPLAGWLVRYEIVGGPQAGFGLDAAQVIEVETNPQGQATADIVQMAPSAGTSEVRIQIVRRPDAQGKLDRQFIAATGTTQVTWSAPDVSIEASGPAVSSIGAVAAYRFTVTNRGNLPTTGVVVTGEVPPGMTHLSSRPAPDASSAQANGARLQWTLGNLAAGESRTIDLDVRTAEKGIFNFCGEVTSADASPTKSCTSTTVSDRLVAAVELDIRGPAEAIVGERVTFEIIVTNRGTTAATGLRIWDEFPAGLKHDKATSPIERRKIVDLAPGQQDRINVTFTVIEVGELCHTAKVTGDGGLSVAKRACVRATAVAPAKTPNVSLRITPPKDSRVGESVQFTVDVSNTGNVPLNNLTIKVTSDLTLEATFATSGHTGKVDLSWVVDSLAVGATKQVGVEYKCLQAAAQACVQADVIADNLPARRDRQCIRVGAAQAVQKPAMNDLTLKVAERTSPVMVGGKTTYEVFVRNVSDKTFHDVTLSAVVPAEMKLDEAGLTPEQIQGNVATFAAVAALGPGQEIRYQVQATAKQPGNARFVARLSARELSEPMEAEKITVVFAER
jgi:uncharacterized repeat protein (TIGR01451 family)